MITEISVNSWKDPLDVNIQQTILNDIEEGKIVFLPSLKFNLLTHEKKFLSSGYADLRSKNISFDPKTSILKGCAYAGEDLNELKIMMERFANSTRKLIFTLFPHYKECIKDGRTSYRPTLTEGRIVTSIRKDDSKLHIDSFASQPVGGFRLLRVFSNINPSHPRIWKLGEPFEKVADRFLPKISKRQWISPRLLCKFGITKGVRTLYDHIMLQIHNSMKQDSGYQKSVSQQKFSFPSGSTWIVMTDKVSHAALSGQYLLEQTFYLPVKAMQKPELSPLVILEQKVNKKLV